MHPGFGSRAREQILLLHHTEDAGQTGRRMDLSPVSIGQRKTSVHNYVLDSLPHLARGSDYHRWSSFVMVVMLPGYPY